MSSFRRLMSALNVQPLLTALAEHAYLWREITVRQDTPGSPHHDTEAIWLRGPREITLQSVFNDTACFDYPALNTLAQPLIALFTPILQTIGSTRLGRVMIVALKPGGQIDAHEDTGRYAKAYSRFHLSLQSEPGNVFECDGEQVHMAPGELWWFNHRGQHTVRNESDQPRIHLIFDAEVPQIAVPALTSVQRNPTAGMRIVEMNLLDRIDECWGLLEAHWHEIARNKQVMVLNPDRERYAQLQEQGALLTLAVLDPDGEIVGYSVNFFGPHIHYADLIVCNNDLLFLREDLRPSRIGLQLLKETERAATARGARLMLWHAKENTALAKIMPRMGYGVQDIIFSKQLGD